MNKIKKVLLLAMSLVMATGLFTGCFMGGTNNNGNGTSVETIVGKSAYQVWLENGHEGTEQDFLDWLRGETGEDGEAGEDGKSAYQIWLEAGNEGTEEDFLNWLKGEDCSCPEDKESSTQTPDSSTQTPDSSVEEAKKYTFSVITDRWAVDGTTSSEVEAGAELALPAAPEAEGKTFAGWVDLEGNKVEAGAKMPEADYAIYATWEINAYTLTIKQEGKDDVTLKFGVEAVPATETEAEIIDINSLSFVLEGLYADTAEATYEIKDAPEEWTLADTTITVEASPVEYTLVIRDGNPMMGGYYEEKTVAFGAEIELPDPLEADGKNFLGWVMVDVETNEVSEVPETMPAGNVFIAANWEVIAYTLTIKQEGQDDVTLKFGVESVPATETTAEIIAIGYSLDTVLAELLPAAPDEYTQYSYDAIPEEWPLADVTLNIVKTVREYTVTMRDGNPLTGITVNTMKVAYNTEIAYPTPEAEGKTFLGWIALDEEGKEVEAPTVMPASDITVMAAWEINAYELKVTDLDGNVTTYYFGVEAVPETETEAAIIGIDTLSFVLEGLLPEATETTEYAYEGIPAEWALQDTEISVVASARKYTITFINTLDRRGMPETKEIANGTAIEYPTYDAVEGMNFAGWVVVDIETNVSSAAPTVMPTNDLTVYTDWQVIVYTLTINRVDGTVDTYKFGVQDVYADDPADTVIGIGYSLDKVIEESKSVPTASCYDVEYVGIPESGIALEDTTISEQKVDKEGNEHDFSKVEGDETGHWNACIGCGEKEEVVGHTSSFESNNNGMHNEVCGVCGYVLGSAVECNGVWSEEITEDGMKQKVCACGYVDEAFIIDVSNEKVYEINLDLNEAGETTATFTLFDILDEDIVQFEKYGLISMYWGDVKLFDFMADDLGMDPMALEASVFGTAYGLQTLSMGVMTSDDVQHVIDVQVLLVTSVIETKEELVAFNTLSKLCEEDANTYGGYFKLGANITLNNPVQIYKGGQTVWNAAFESIDTNGFVGTFDGCGYAIDGMIVNAKDMNSPAAFITEIGEGGVLKNVAFTNAVISGARSVITAYNAGTVENVYVHVFSFGGWIQKDTGMFTTFNEGWCGSSAAIINGGAWDAPGTVRNLFVDMTASAIVNTQDPTTNANYGKTWHDDPNVADTTVNALKLFGKPAGDAVYEGIYVVGIPANLAMLANNKTESDLFAGYVDFAAMKAAYDAENSALAAEIATWPTWLRGNAIVNVLDTVELSNRQSVNLDLQVANAAVTTSAAAAEIDISEIGENVGDLIAISYDGKTISGCSLEGAKVSVPVAAFGFDFGEKTMEVVTTTGKYSVPVLLVSKVIKTAADLDAMNYIAKACGSVSGEWNGYFQLGNNIQYNGNWVPMNDFSMGRVLPMDFVDDLTADADGYAMYNGRYLISGNKLVLLSALQVEGAVVDTGSKNWAQAGWGTGNSVKYNNTWLYVSNSVDKDTLNWAARGEGFIGTFDGCGYAIDGVKVGVDMSYSGFFGQVGNGALIKNVAFTNAEYHAMSMGGFLACFAKSGSVVENVYIQLTHTITGAGSAISATDNFRSQDGLTLRNVFVDASTITVTSSQYSVLGGSTEADKNTDGVADTYTVYQGAYAIVNNETQKTNAYGKGGIHANSTNHGVYVGAEAMKNDAAAQAEIATWDTTYWTIVEGVPTWNK